MKIDLFFFLLYVFNVLHCVLVEVVVGTVVAVVVVVVVV